MADSEPLALPPVVDDIQVFAAVIVITTVHLSFLKIFIGL